MIIGWRGQNEMQLHRYPRPRRWPGPCRSVQVCRQCWSWFWRDDSPRHAVSQLRLQWMQFVHRKTVVLKKVLVWRNRKSEKCKVSPMLRSNWTFLLCCNVCVCVYVSSGMQTEQHKFIGDLYDCECFLNTEPLEARLITTKESCYYCLNPQSSAPPGLCLELMNPPHTFRAHGTGLLQTGQWVTRYTISEATSGAINADPYTWTQVKQSSRL